MMHTIRLARLACVISILIVAVDSNACHDVEQN
jgi:hypothetical protein